MSPEDIRNKTFSIVRKGYERGEVHRFLDTIAQELQTFNAGGGPAEAVIVDESPALAPAPVAEPVVDPTEPDLPDPTDLLGDLGGVDDDLPEPRIADAPPAPMEDVPGFAEPMPAPEPVASFSPEPAPVAASVGPTDFDNFDRVGNEISMMLRQAQESAVKIRTDAEVEARALVDQVRLDIEADRLNHERAAADLIARTEERAGQLRSEAERYSEDTRRSADDYATEQRSNADREHAEAQAASEADRKLAADKLESATREAEATIAAAREEATTIVTTAEKQAHDTSDRMLAEARNTLTNFIGAEQSTRDNLSQARSAIDAALAQLRLTEIDADSLTTPSAVSSSSDVMHATSEEFLSTSLLGEEGD